MWSSNSRRAERKLDGRPNRPRGYGSFLVLEEALEDEDGVKMEHDSGVSCQSEAVSGKMLLFAGAKEAPQRHMAGRWVCTSCRRLIGFSIDWWSCIDVFVSARMIPHHHVAEAFAAKETIQGLRAASRV